MPTYRVPVEWTQMGYMYIEADSPEEAAEQARFEELPLPPETEYLDDSFNVLDEWIEEYNPQERTCYCSMFGDKKICGPGCTNDED